MSRHRALLLFVPRFQSDGWQDLDYLEGEFHKVRTELDQCGYEISEDSSCDHEELTYQGLTRRIETFLRSARRGDHLVVYLSGHGFYYDRTLWFVGSDSDALSDSKAVIRSSNLPLDDHWADTVGDDTRAENVLFVVDACRERLSTDRYERLSPVKPLAGHDRLTYLLACAPSEAAAFSGNGDERSSLFTKALLNILSDGHEELPAGRLHVLLTEEMADLQERHRGELPARLDQRPRLSGEHGEKQFPFLPRTGSPAQERLRLLSEHAVWNRTDARGQRLAPTVETVARTVSDHLEEERRRLADHPWIDWEADQRACHWLSLLINRYFADSRFSEAEVAFLTLTPMLYHLQRVHNAQLTERELQRFDDQDEDWADYSSLLQRVAPGRRPGPRERDVRTVRLWLLQQRRSRLSVASDRLSDGTLEAWRQVSKSSPSSLLPELLDVKLLSWLFQAMQHGGSILASPPPETGPAAGTIRRRLIGYLLTLSQAMALDLADLPRVLVDHLRSDDGTSLRQTKRTIEDAEWTTGDNSLALVASCPHQAVMAALQEHAASVDGLLYHASHRVPSASESAAELARLPVRASGDHVLPERGERGLKFLSVATRFGLDGARVRDLLTGEQLYRDRSLAVRELYQNAMDACAVRQAREQSHPAREPGRPAWKPTIEIHQKSDGHRMYVECVDNGSGMDRYELVEAFAQGGARLSHLASFQQEQADWESRGIDFHRNSRFGIGVLSYFMLADEIQVVTRKFNRDRTFEQPLRVTVFGPDDLFEVKDQVDEPDFNGDACGTRVRLYLNPRRAADLSCVQALRNVLAIARFQTLVTYEEKGESEEWAPDEFRPRAGSAIDAGGQVVRDGYGDVFWCERGGALLIDGIVAEANWSQPATVSFPRKMTVEGAVVNLRGRIGLPGRRNHAVPRLSVDRNSILDDVGEPVVERLQRAVDSLPGSGLLSEEWLERMAEEDLRIADAVVAALSSTPARLTGRRGSYALERTGYFPGDQFVRAGWTGGARNHRITFRSEPGHAWLPDHLALWRYTAHFPDEVAEALGEHCPAGLRADPPGHALPSHSYALGYSGSDRREPPLWRSALRLSDIAVHADELSLPITDVIDRLRPLNMDWRGPDPQPDVPLADFLRLISLDGDAQAPWLEPGDPVSVFALLTVAENSHRPVQRLVELMGRLGYSTEHCGYLRDPASPMFTLAHLVVSQHCNRRGPWVARADAERILHVANALNMSPDEARTAHLRLGIQVSHPARVLSGDDDTCELVHQKYAVSHDPDPSRAVFVSAHVICIALDERRTIEETVRRLQALGYRMPENLPDRLPEIPDELVGVLTSDAQILDLARPVPLPALHVLSRRTGRPMKEVAHHLEALGLQVPFRDIPDTLTPQDLQLLSTYVRQHGDWRSHWLAPDIPVPVAHLVLAAAVQGEPVETCAERLRQLGMTTTESPAGTANLRQLAGTDERTLVGRWIPYTPEAVDPVPPGHLISTMSRHGWTPEETREQFLLRGMTVREEPLRDSAVLDDIALLSQAGDGKSPLVPLDTVWRTEQVVRVAHAVRRPIPEVRARLIELGAPVPTPPSRASREAETDTVPKHGSFGRSALPSDPEGRRSVHALDMSFLSTGKFPLLPEDAAVVLPAAHVYVLAATEDISLLSAKDRLLAGGLLVQEFDYPDRPPNLGELRLLRLNASHLSDWLDPYPPVPLEHLLVTAHVLNTTVSDVAKRLADLGVNVPDVGRLVADAWAKVPKKHA
ncbi:wHTH domain-containing protein [Streptomyces flaveolus]|uniref:wHTH domain-containing protein n=1 Tax=Streptomyces flaveolus TaxID=67297 RepID=UPI003322D654